MSGRLEGRVALITGGGTGIGAATARLFAREGARVAICGRRREPLESVAKEIRDAGGSVELAPLDVTDEHALRGWIEGTAARESRLDVLVNNAFSMIVGSIENLSTEDWQRSFRTTLDAAFYGMRTALPIMARQGGGAIVNVSSTAGHAGQAGLAGYATAKAALENLTRTAAVEGAASRVRVNAVAPGVIATEGTEAAFADPAARRAMLRMIPLGRFGAPDEVAEAILFLASDAASFVTGACLVVDGGQRASLGAPAIDEGFER